jgi:glycosyltransferase involved in cell wall biosynthesis
MARTVSIVVTCYNFAPYIAETLRSIAAQTHRDFEAIVVDNNSVDGSVELIESVASADRRFTLVREPAQGVHHSLNAGLTRATGDIVLLLDGDDVCRPERVAETLRCFDATGADLVACNGQRIDATGRLEEVLEPYFHSLECLPAVMCQYNPIWSVSLLALSRRALRSIGALPEAQSRILDWHLLMSALESQMPVALLDKLLVLKRYHGRNLAFDVEITERQAIPRLSRFMERYGPASAAYTERERSRLLTARYLRAVEYMRRAGKWSALPDYLSDHVGPGRIREEVHRFAVSVAWYHLDRARFLREALACRCDHPLAIFLRGLAQLASGDSQAAARSFERAYVKPLRRFPEALNSWAVAESHVDRARAVRLLEQVVRWSPDYRDAQLNLAHLRLGQTEHCRHTVCLRPETLSWLSDWG